ncbi:MAG: hypothetical protein HEQ10_02380 [Dolichospermum sp. DEX182a]|nr:hypothetical protein [Dolichospermum sp. DEX182a]
MKNFNILLNNSFEIRFPNLDSILNQALQNTSEYLRQFRFDAGYTTKLETAFGSDFNQQIANSIFDKLAQEDFSDIPSIEIVSRNDINGANGAFAIATGKIYLSQEFITANAQNVNAIVAVLLEEYGHYVDAEINTKDAAGDEGDIFARLVQGDSLSEQELAVLKAEDDSATVTLDGQVVQIEQNSLQVTFYENTMYGGNSLSLAPGNYNQDQFGSLGNDKLSSLKIPEGLSVRLYADHYFEGKYKDYTSGNIDDVKDFNDLTSSIQIIQGPSIETFRDTNYGGNSFRFAPGNYNQTDFGSLGYDALSSLKIPEGLSVRLYADHYYQGKYKDYTSGNIDDVKDFNDLTSSIQVIRGPSIEIFQDTSYGGNSFRLAPGKYNYNNFGSLGNNTLSSLKIPKELTVILYADDQPQTSNDSSYIENPIGKYKVFNSGDYSSVGDDFNDQTSYIVINTKKNIEPQSLTPAQFNNLSERLQKWAESYAQSLGRPTMNVKLVNNQLQMLRGDLKFDQDQSLQIKEMTRNASMLFRNNSTESSNVTFSYSDGKGYEISNQDTTQWETGNTVGASLTVTASGSAGVPFVASGQWSVTGGASYEHSWSNGASKTKINTNNVNTQENTSILFSAPASAVTKATATATGGEYSGGQYEIPVTISGTIGIDLNGDGDALDTYEISAIPVSAILQSYDLKQLTNKPQQLTNKPQQFIGEGLDKTFQLPQGDNLPYKETTKAKVTGTANGANFRSISASTASAYDWSLTNPTTSEYANGVNKQQFGQGIEERYWLISGSQYGPRPSGTHLRIQGFNPTQDFIGIDHNIIKSNDDIMLGTNVGVGIDPANKLILQAGSYTKDKITYQTTQILMGGTGKDLKSIKDNDVLAELIGVTPNQLLGSSRQSLTRDLMTSNFMFGTQGTIWDNGLNSSSSGTNLLRLL